MGHTRVSKTRTGLVRQEAEWLAVHGALVEGRIRVLRIRLPKHDPSDDDPNNTLVTGRTLMKKMEQWIAEFESGKCLITLGQEGDSLRALTREQVQAIVEQRKRGGGSSE